MNGLDCLDAETVAAWVDGGLTGPAFEQAQAHVADCARCQALVSAVVRTATAAAPEQAAPARAPWWRLFWLAPLAAAAAIAVYVATPSRPSLPGPPVTGARARADLPTVGVAPKKPASGLNNGLSPRAENGPAPVSPAPEAFAPTAGGDARQAALDAHKDAAPGDAASGDTVAATALAAPAAALAAPARTFATEAFSASGRVAQPGRFDVVSPDPMVRWRVTGSKVERSTDGGGSWTPQVTGNPGDLVAGSAPLPLVCWLIGRQGVVLLTVDGETWRQVRFPEITDLSAVQASSAREAMITTTAGRTFRTADGGATWSR